MIPDFEENGYLPLGVHFCEWEEVVERFGINQKRLRLIQVLRMAMEELKYSGCQTIYINGSFISSKENPGDFDMCWEESGININYLKTIAPTLYNFGLRRTEQKNKYRGEIFPANYPANETGILYIDFFQFDTRTNIFKGIIAIDLKRWTL